VKIIQYGHIDGIPTFRDSSIMGLYDRMEKDQTDKIVFHDGSIRNRDEFLSLMKRSVLAVAMIGETPLGFGWLTDIYMKRAQAHFCMFSEVWGHAVEIGIALVEYLSEIQYQGDYLTNVLIGYVPSSNKAAIKFAQLCGGKVLGEIPQAAYFEDKGKSEPATIVYYQRR
jgi:hypothetical protein